MPSSVLHRPRPTKKLWAGRLLGIVGIVVFTVLGVVRRDRSLDVAYIGESSNRRYGFYENTLPAVWVCPDGHQHYSLPFWAGALACAIPTALWWLAWPRRRT